MADFSGTIKFINDPKDAGIVFQTKTGSLLEDGFRYVKANLSAKVVGNSINYNYQTGNVDTNAITII